MKKLQQGFTLIELMIVVAIIGILAAIAIPQYQTFIAKSQVSRAVGESGALKTAVEDCLNNGILVVGDAAAVPAQCDPQESASTIMATGLGAYNNPIRGAVPLGSGVPLVVIAADGSVTIVATFGNKASNTLQVPIAHTITWARDTEGAWVCNSTADAKYNTASCPIL